ncbi:MAG: mRNA surveillance protein pelota [Halobacteriales archaeon]|nr:mRNA surveillance protein pelota [Halobacteriales archaeon]
MRIRGRERLEADAERVTLVPEHLDDLWHLQYVLEPGDRVGGETSRRVQRDDEQLRDTGGQREPMSVTLAVEEAEFHEFANRLRVSGEIVACSREDEVGHHHTLNVEPFDELSIEKVWKPDQNERLEQAEESADRPDVVIATVEEAAAHVHSVSQAGAEERTSLTGPTGKGEYARDRSELFTALGDVLSNMDPDAVILAGPGFTKQDALDHIEDAHPELVERITVVDTASVGDRGVHEVFSRGAVDEVLAETRLAAEAQAIDELMRRVKSGVKAVYGPEAVERAAEFGAVEELLVLDERLRAQRGGSGEWPIDVNDVIQTVEQKGGEVTVFTSEFDPGRQLEGLGGIAALLRYRIE